LFTAYLDSIPHNALGLILDYPGKIRLPRDVLFIPSLYLISGNYKGHISNNNPTEGYNSLKRKGADEDMHPSSKEFLDGEKNLPSSYGRDRLVLLPRDPYWIFAYWEISPSTYLFLERETRQPKDFLELVLRVYRYHWGYDNDKVESHFDLKLSPSTNNWYINAGVPDRKYKTELGYYLADTEFKSFLTSNFVMTPRDSLSDVIDEKWRLPDWQARRLYRRITLSNLSSPERLMLQRHSTLN
jgi:hypothetical protein